MCGRYTLTAEQVSIRSRLAKTDLVKVSVRPRYNIAPMQRVPVLVVDKGGLVEKEMRWGWTPVWSKQLLINAQAETVEQKATFQAAYKKRRCLIPADGFYEWQVEDGKKVPVRFVLKSGEPFCFAGIWEPWLKPTAREELADNDFPDEPAASEVVESVVILTTAANDVVRPVHGRMPVILQEPHYDWWLAGGGDGALAAMALQHPRNGELEYYRVTALVNDVRQDEPRCIARNEQPRWF